VLRQNVSPCGSPFRRNGGRITFGVALVVEPPASRHFVQHRIYEILRFENFVFSLELRKFALRSGKCSLRSHLPEWSRSLQVCEDASLRSHFPEHCLYDNVAHCVKTSTIRRHARQPDLYEVCHLLPFQRLNICTC
jgi:hypothetical protein